MRIYANARQLMSEIFRDVLEMGIKVHPHSMQNKIVEGDENFATLEITNYGYCLTAIPDEDYLFLFEDTKAWCQAELAERVSPTPVNPGEAWKLRPETWAQFMVGGKFEYTYNQRFNSYGGLVKILNEIHKNPDSRQLILSVWDRSDVHFLGGKSRVPCSIYYQFLLRNGKLDIIYNQRSADVVTHFGNDIWLAFNLMKWVVDQVNSAWNMGIHYGWLYHNIGSLHCYNKDLNTLKQCVDEI